MPKSRARGVYEKLSSFDRRQVDVRTGRTPGVIFTNDFPTVNFDEAVKEVAAEPGSYTTKPGGVVRNSRLNRKANKRSF